MREFFGKDDDGNLQLISGDFSRTIDRLGGFGFPLCHVSGGDPRVRLQNCHFLLYWGHGTIVIAVHFEALCQTHDCFVC